VFIIAICHLSELPFCFRKAERSLKSYVLAKHTGYDEKGAAVPLAIE